MICPRCGKENLDENLFCSYCGKRLDESSNNNKCCKKVIISVIAIICVVGVSIGGYMYFKQHNENINNTQPVNGLTENEKESEIKKKISEADKVAQSGQYLYAISKLKVVKLDYDFSQYPKLAEEINQKQGDYEYKNYCIECLDKLKKKDFYHALCNISELVENYSHKEGIKELCNSMLVEVKNEISNVKSYNNYISEILVYIAIACPENKDSIQQLFNLNESYSNEKHEDFNEKIKLITNTTNKVAEDRKKEPAIGMSKADVRYSTWGEPKKINETITTTAKREQWVYSSDRYIYFDNDVVTGIQK